MCMETGVSPGPQGIYYDPEQEISDGLIRSVSRSRIIRSTLARCSDATQATLRAYYEPNLNRFSAPIRKFFDDLAPLVVRTLGLYDTETIVQNKEENSTAVYTAKSHARSTLNAAMEEFANAWSLLNDARSDGSNRSYISETI